jgi:phosphoribosylformylglycinamidine synthase
MPRALILRAPGTNCDGETVHAFERAGAGAVGMHVNEVLASPAALADYQILCIPGGFSYGDDIAAGRILANQLRNHLAEVLADFHAAGKLILGICNGFQVLLKTGLLLAEDDTGPIATLAWNDSGHFEDRWVRLAVDGNHSVFLAGLEKLELPIAHAEGKFVPRDADTLTKLDTAGQLVLRYAASNSAFRTPYSALVPYPDNPNGSVANVAGVSDDTGRVLGLMPHPERYIDPTQHPRWTREPLREVGDGLAIFQNAVRYFI